MSRAEHLNASVPERIHILGDFMKTTVVEVSQFSAGADHKCWAAGGVMHLNECLTAVKVAGLGSEVSRFFRQTPVTTGEEGLNLIRFTDCITQTINA